MASVRNKEITCLDDEMQLLRSNVVLFEYKQQASQGRELCPKSSILTWNFCQASHTPVITLPLLLALQSEMQGSNFQMMVVDEER